MGQIEQLYHEISSIHERFIENHPNSEPKEMKKIRGQLLDKAIGRLEAALSLQQTQLALEIYDPAFQETWQKFKERVQQLPPKGQGRLQQIINKTQQGVLQNKQDKQKVIEKLCEKYPDILKGGDINQIGNDQMTPLIRAVLQNNISMVKILIELGADVSVVNDYGQTAFMYAAANGQLGVVNALQAADADISVVDNNKASALMFAAENGQLGVVDALLIAGVDVSAVDNNGKSALMHAAASGRLGVVNALVNASREAGVDISVTDNDKMSALMLAAKNGYVEVVNALHEAGADVSTVDNDGWSAFMYAAAYGHVRVVNTLREAGANIAAVDNDGTSALMLAAKNGHVAVVNALHEAGADVLSIDNYGQSALMCAAASGHVEVVKALLEAEADAGVSVVAKNGMSALMLAAMNGHVDVVKTLFEAGADVLAVDNYGQSALEFAVHCEAWEIVQMLNRDGAIHKVLANAMMDDQTTQVNALIKNGASLETAKNIIKIKMLALIWGLKGKMTIEDEIGRTVTFELEKGNQLYVLRMLLEYIINFYEDNLFKLKEDSMEIKLLRYKKEEIQTSIANALYESASSNIDPNVIENIQLGKPFQPIVLLGGSKDHAVSMFICHTKNGTEVMICNKGTGASSMDERHVLANRYFFRDISNLNEARIKQLTKNCDDMEEFNDMISKMLEPLPDDVDRLVQKLQKVENCTSASAKGIIAISLWRLCISEPEELEELSKIGIEPSEIEIIAHNAYKGLFTWVRKETLSKMLGSNPDKSLVLKVMKKYIKKFFADRSSSDREYKKLMLGFLKKIKSSQASHEEQIRAMNTLRSMLEERRSEEPDIKDISILLENWLDKQIHKEEGVFNNQKKNAETGSI